MKEVQVFQSEEFGKIRTVSINGDPWFVGKDVATRLGYKKPENALSVHVDDEDKTTTLIQGTGSNYKTTVTIINESGLYSLVLSSKIPTAKAFKRWITSEVIPSIRKTGAYQMGAELDQLRAKNEELDKVISLLSKNKARLNDLCRERDEAKKYCRDAKAKYMSAKATYGKWCDLVKSFEDLVSDASKRVNSCIDRIQFIYYSKCIFDDLESEMLDSMLASKSDSST